MTVFTANEEKKKILYKVELNSSFFHFKMEIDGQVESSSNGAGSQVEAVSGAQPSWPEEDDGGNGFLPTDAERHFEEFPTHPYYTPVRGTARKSAKGKKRPRQPEFTAEQPDVGRYFDELASWGTDIENVERIRICRAYASYLVSLEPPLPRKRR